MRFRDRPIEQKIFLLILPICLVPALVFLVLVVVGTRITFEKSIGSEISEQALQLYESLFLELRQKGAPIGVSVVCPELIATRIGDADRNRPLHWKRGDEPASPERDLVEGALRTATQTQGAPPERIAERTLEAIRAERFYVLAPEGDPWRTACHARLDAIRHERNPGMPPSDSSSQRSAGSGTG